VCGYLSHPLDENDETVVIATDYEFPAKVLTFRERLYAQHPSFLNVRLYGKKVAKTPPQYVYEFDVQLPDK
jgi:hypothetical protein